MSKRLYELVVHNGVICKNVYRVIYENNTFIYALPRGSNNGRLIEFLAHNLDNVNLSSSYRILITFDESKADDILKNSNSSIIESELKDCSLKLHALEKDEELLRNRIKYLTELKGADLSEGKKDYE